jgi:hypothetical protein
MIALSRKFAWRLQPFAEYSSSGAQTLLSNSRTLGIMAVIAKDIPLSNEVQNAILQWNEVK